MRQRLLVIVNPTSGVTGRPLLPRVIAELERAGATVSTATPSSGAQARRVAAEAARSTSLDVIVASGGDGTFRQVAIGALGTEMPVGLIPAGNGNVLARDLVLGRDAGSIARVLLGGATKELRGGLANGEPFFLMAGAGFDARIAAALDRRMQNRFGSLAYAGPITRTLLGAPDRLEVTVDGTRHEAGWVIVSNARHYAGAFRLVPGTDAVTPGLHAVLFPPSGRAALTRHLLALAAGQLHRQRDVAVLPCERVTVTSAAPVATEIDGDPFGSTPLSIEPNPQSLRLIVA